MNLTLRRRIITENPVIQYSILIDQIQQRGETILLTSSYRTPQNSRCLRPPLFESVLRLDTVRHLDPGEAKVRCRIASTTNRPRGLNIETEATGRPLFAYYLKTRNPIRELLV